MSYVSSMASHRGSSSHVVAEELQRTSIHHPSAAVTCLLSHSTRAQTDALQQHLLALVGFATGAVAGNQSVLQ